MNSEEWIRSLSDVGDDGGPPPWWQPGGGRVMRGRVLADSAVQHFDGLRAASVTDERQLVLAAGNYTLALELATMADHEVTEYNEIGGFGSFGEPGDADLWRLVRGRIDGPGIVAVQIVAPNGVEVALTIPDEFGEFEFLVPTGQWLLVVSDDDHDVEVAFDVD